jgi:hypothetical protein
MRLKAPIFGVLLKKIQHKNIQLIIKLLVQYRDLIDHICSRKIQINDYEWLSKFKYHIDSESTKTKSPNLIVKVGFYI